MIIGKCYYRQWLEEKDSSHPLFISEWISIIVKSAILPQSHQSATVTAKPLSVNWSQLISWQQVSLRWIIICQILLEASRYWSLTNRESKFCCDSEQPDGDDDKGKHNEDGNREYSININNWHTRFDTDKWQINIFSNNKIIDIIRKKKRNKKHNKIEIVTTTHCVDHHPSMTSLQKWWTNDCWRCMIGKRCLKRINKNKAIIWIGEYQCFGTASLSTRRCKTITTDSRIRIIGTRWTPEEETNGWRMRSNTTRKHPEQLNTRLVWFHVISNWANERTPGDGSVTRNTTTTRNYNKKNTDNWLIDSQSNITRHEDSSRTTLHYFFIE